MTRARELAELATSYDSGLIPFPVGTRMLFAQTAAPTGWTKDTTQNDKALRVVSGTAGSGGSVAFSSAFSSQAVSGTVGSTTLTESQIPSHAHAITGFDVFNTSAFSINDNGGDSLVSSDNAAQNSNGYFRNARYSTVNTGGGGSHNHSFAGTAINLAVQYVDVIIATKD